MLGAQSNHALGIVVVTLGPRRIEVVPIKIRITAAFHGTAKTDLSTKLSPDPLRWRSVHSSPILAVAITTNIAAGRKAARSGSRPDNTSPRIILDQFSEH
jgi:hypothetical protein